jgi:hypothetical protein
MAAKTRVFCLEESMWEDDLVDRESVLPMLEFLERSWKIEYIHRHVATRAEFEEYLAYWRGIKRSWSLAYFAFHGSPGGFCVHGEADDSFEPLVELADKVGRSTGAVYHLGTCSTLKGPKGAAAAREFLRKTNAAALTGFIKDVDRVEAAAADLLLLDHLAQADSPGEAIRAMRRRHTEFCQRVGLQAFHSR